MTEFADIHLTPEQAAHHARLLGMVCRELQAEYARRDAIAEDFLISGAFPRDLSAIETRAPMRRFDLNDRSGMFKVRHNAWRIA